MNIEQTSLDQTGILVMEMDETKELKTFPLFSLTPLEEAKELSSFIEGGSLKHVFISNNLMDNSIEQEIKEYKEENNDSISEELMDELVAGFPLRNILNYTEDNVMVSCYV